MKCFECDHEMVTTVEPYRYKDAGLPGVTLLGIEVSRCPVCGDQEVAIPRIEGLHRAIAVSLIEKSARLTSEEIRYLRKYLDMSGVDFARMMRVDPSTVSRWERGDQPMGESSDLLLRTFVILREPVNYHSVDMLDRAAKDDPMPLRVALQPAPDGWTQASL